LTETSADIAENLNESEEDMFEKHENPEEKALRPHEVEVNVSQFEEMKQ